MSINTYWWDFARNVANKLKKGWKLTHKEKNDMVKLWKIALKKGFKPKQQS